MFVLTAYVDGFDLANVWNGFNAGVLVKMGANYAPLLKESYQVWRLVSYMFLHGSIIHILVNMYSLVALGNQIETFFGKAKFLIIYFISGIAGGLLSAAAGGVTSVGASGAIFGLLGSMLYFGFHYRAYFGQAVKLQILPVIAINLAIGFMMPNIDNWCHIGGLVGGFLITMALGVNGKSKKSDQINGTICTLLYLGFLIYLVFIR